MGGPSRHADGAAGRRGDRRRRDRDRLHEHALADGDLVSGDSRRASGLGGHDRAASWLARSEDDATGSKNGLAHGNAALRRRDVVASTSASISPRSIACCRSEVRRESRGLLQRAGRSGHRPGAVSRVTCVPTNALELHRGRGGARRHGAAARSRRGYPVERPLDVLAQHLVTVALGGGFRPGRAAARRCARRVPTPICTTTSGRGYSVSSSTAATRCAGIRNIRMSCPSNDRWRRRGSRDRAAASHVDRHDRQRCADRTCNICAAKRSARWKNRSSRGSSRATGSSSPALRSSSFVCATWSRGFVARRTPTARFRDGREADCRCRRARGAAPRATRRGSARCSFAVRRWRRSAIARSAAKMVAHSGSRRASDRAGEDA